MKVLILNRRDIKNPFGGGAELYTHEVAKGLAEGGCDVTILSSRYKSAPFDETIEGVGYHRLGNEFTVHLFGFLYALRRLRKFDLIIDEFNGIGFFTFLFPQSILLIHQLYREFWLRELGPAGAVPYVIEHLMLKLYKNRPAITVSDSTRQDLESLGFKNIHIVMNALSNRPLDQIADKEPMPTLIFLGRLRSTKKPEDAIDIFRLVKKEFPDARLWMVGSGPDEEKLGRMAEGLEDVTFYGRLEEDRKFELLRRAHILIVPGVREGFGINVIEAASQGTPAVGYDVHGLRDSIRDGLTGLLARGPEDAAEKAIRLFKDKELYGKMAENCLEYAKGFDWQRRAEEFRRTIKGLILTFN